MQPRKLAHQLSAYRRGLLLDNAVARAGQISVLLAAGTFLSASEMALVATPRTVLGPITILYVGIVAIGTSQASRMFQQNAEQIDQFVRRVRSILVLLALTFVAFAVAIAGELERFGAIPDSATARQFLMIVGLGTICAAFGHAARIGLRGQGLVDVAARAQLMIAVLIVTLGLAGALLFGAMGLASGVAAAQLLGVPIWMRSYATRSATEHHGA
jgi:O-antigen/teichoic acid export membrane protein